MRPHDPPPPTYAFGYRQAPVSGNEINGLGVAERTRARKVFHNPGGETLPWDALDHFFALINPRGVVRHILANMWQLRRRDGPVNPGRVDVPDPAAMSARIKDTARDLGADLVGVTRLTDDVLYAGAEVPTAMPSASACGWTATRCASSRSLERLSRSCGSIGPSPGSRSSWASTSGTWAGRRERTATPTARISSTSRSPFAPVSASRQARVTDQQGARIERPARHRRHRPPARDRRGGGHRRRRPVLHLPALRARLPAGRDHRREALVRGEEKWYVDFDKCVPYFTKTYGCAICIQVCRGASPVAGRSSRRSCWQRGTSARDGPRPVAERASAVGFRPVDRAVARDPREQTLPGAPIDRPARDSLSRCAPPSPLSASGGRIGSRLWGSRSCCSQRPAEGRAGRAPCPCARCATARASS